MPSCLKKICTLEGAANSTSSIHKNAKYLHSAFYMLVCCIKMRKKVTFPSYQTTTNCLILTVMEQNDNKRVT